MDERTTPNHDTRATEREDAATQAGADRMPTSAESDRADELEVDPEVAAHEREMAERGAHQKGEGRTP